MSRNNGRIIAIIGAVLAIASSGGAAALMAEAAAARQTESGKSRSVQYETQGSAMIQELETPQIESAEAGEIITFGRYEQGGMPGNKAEPIEWLVLDNKGDRMLIISRYGLDSKPYNEERKDVTWETCTLRKWLNSEFYNTAFNAAEKSLIITTAADNPDNAKWNVQGGSATDDNVFCLSIEEANMYFLSEDERTAKPTPYAQSRGAYANISAGQYSGCCWWRLRSPGFKQDFVAHVGISGAVDESGEDAAYAGGAVRPALWIRRQ